jgi:drug/metabolite transporter (DMT)-like permease
MFPTWLSLSLAALLMWGGWGLFANLAARHLGGFSALVWEVIGAVLVGTTILFWLLRNEGMAVPARGALFGIATGVTYTIGLAFLFLALNHARGNQDGASDSGNIHTVFILTALYPVLVVGLNYAILGEPISVRQVIGMVVGLAGIAILVSR